MRKDNSALRLAVTTEYTPPHQVLTIALLTTSHNDRRQINPFTSSNQIILGVNPPETYCLHHASSFYENLPAAEAFALAQAFEMHYTPKKGS